MNRLQKLLAFRSGIVQHLAELSQLTGTIVTRDALLSVEDTEAIRERSKTMVRVPTWTETLDFSEKEGARFLRFIGSLSELNPSDVYIWVPHSRACGLLPPVPLETIQWGFSFNFSPDGIFSLVTSDLCDKMLIEFSETATGRRELEIEISGPHWGRSSY
jgi:hypothetical protein